VIPRTQIVVERPAGGGSGCRYAFSYYRATQRVTPRRLAHPFVDPPKPFALHSIPTKSLGIEDPPLTTATPPTTRPAFHGSGAVSFSTKGEYGVRLMVQLGRHFGQGPASLAEIATEEDLPRAYLEQLVVSLRDAGLVSSTRGAHGGYELTRDPATIRMSEVLRALEGPLAPMICASNDPEHATVCDRSSRCTVNVLWVRVRDAVTGALDAVSLADLVPALGAPATLPTTTLTGALTPP
jgi:Rrf2 family protein